MTVSGSMGREVNSPPGTATMVANFRTVPVSKPPTAELTQRSHAIYDGRQVI